MDYAIVGTEYLSIFAAAKGKYAGMPDDSESDVHVGKW